MFGKKKRNVSVNMNRIEQRQIDEKEGKEKTEKETGKLQHQNIK